MEVSMATVNRGPKITATTAGHIKWLRENTTLNQAQIAATLGALNQGRVSEVLTGKRFIEAQPIPYAMEQSHGAQ
jgi:hypothetical protein